MDALEDVVLQVPAPESGVAGAEETLVVTHHAVLVVSALQHAPRLVALVAVDRVEAHLVGGVEAQVEAEHAAQLRALLAQVIAHAEEAHEVIKPGAAVLVVAPNTVLVLVVAAPVAGGSEEAQRHLPELELVADEAAEVVVHGRVLEQLVVEAGHDGVRSFFLQRGELVIAAGLAAVGVIEGTEAVEALRIVEQRGALQRPVGEAQAGAVTGVEGLEVVPEVVLGVVGRPYFQAVGEPLGQALQLDVDATTGEVAGQVGREGLGGYDVVQYARRDQVQLSAVAVGIDAGQAQTVDGRSAVAVAQSPHVNVLAVNDRRTGHLRHGVVHVGGTEAADLLAGDHVLHFVGVLAQLHHGHFAALDGGGFHLYSQVAEVNSPFLLAVQREVQNGRFLGRDHHVGHHLVGVAQVAGHQRVGAGRVAELVFPLDEVGRRSHGRPLDHDVGAVQHLPGLVVNGTGNGAGLRGKHKGAQEQARS